MKMTHIYRKMKKIKLSETGPTAEEIRREIEKMFNDPERVKGLYKDTIV